MTFDLTCFYCCSNYNLILFALKGVFELLAVLYLFEDRTTTSSQNPGFNVDLCCILTTLSVLPLLILIILFAFKMLLVHIV